MKSFNQYILESFDPSSFESAANRKLNEVTFYTDDQKRDKNIARMEERHLEMLKKLAARFKENPDSVKSNTDRHWTAHRLLNMMGAKGYSVRLDDFDPKSSHSRFAPTTYPYTDELSQRGRAEAADNANTIRMIKANPARANIAELKRKAKTKILSFRKTNNWGISNN